MTVNADDGSHKTGKGFSKEDKGLLCPGLLRGGKTGGTRKDSAVGVVTAGSQTGRNQVAIKVNGRCLFIHSLEGYVYRGPGCVWRLSQKKHRRLFFVFGEASTTHKPQSELQFLSTPYHGSSLRGHAPLSHHQGHGHGLTTLVFFRSHLPRISLARLTPTAPFLMISWVPRPLANTSKIVWSLSKASSGLKIILPNLVFFLVSHRCLKKW